jgi:hypothetical protein
MHWYMVHGIQNIFTFKFKIKKIYLEEQINKTAKGNSKSKLLRNA